MIIEAVTILTDALADPTIGVNAQLAGIPLLAGDATPAPVTFIGDEFRDDRVLMGDSPPDLPAIYVTRDGPLILTGEVATNYRDTAAPVSVAIRIFTTHHKDARDNRFNEYYGRAVMRSLKLLMGNAHEADRTSGDIYVISIEQMLWTPLREEVSGCIITGGVAVTLNLRDEAP